MYEKSVKCHEIRHKTIVGLTSKCTVFYQKVCFYNVTLSTLVSLRIIHAILLVFIWKN